MNWLDLVAYGCLFFAAVPCLLFLRNFKLFLPPQALPSYQPNVSVLIPARNEEGSIGACLDSVLKSEGVVLEVIVLDDQSTDRTASIVQDYANRDTRVKLQTAPPLPPGWSGKQHACYVLSQHAQYGILTFIDADVRLQPHGLLRLASFLKTSQAGLVSGFPHQQTGTLLEKLIIPLINWLLLCYLPIDRMRIDKQPGLGAGCGQWFMTTCEAYTQVGGHEAVKDSFHDGVKLPRAYRRVGLMTDLCDGTPEATCRMYRSAAQVWNGLAKNAREGLGSPGMLPIWTLFLGAGHVLPVVGLACYQWFSVWAIAAFGLALFTSYLPRLLAAWRFSQSWFGAVLHPVGVALLLAIQWYANLRHWLGSPVGWKGRPLPQG